MEEIFIFFFNDTATTEIYTLSLHDALPISRPSCSRRRTWRAMMSYRRPTPILPRSEEHTLNSSHSQISYAVFCLKKKKGRHWPGLSIAGDVAGAPHSHGRGRSKDGPGAAGE